MKYFLMYITNQHKSTTQLISLGLCRVLKKKGPVEGPDEIYTTRQFWFI